MAFLALRLLFYEPKAIIGRLRNKEDVIMDWTLWSIEILIAYLSVLSVHLIWR